MKGAIKQLGEICRFEYGSSLPAEKREEGPHPVFGSNGLVGMHSSPVTDGPTIIVGRKGSAGSVNYSEVSCFPIDTTYFIDRTTAKCDLKWLFYALNNLGLNRLNQAAAVPGLNRNLAYIQSLFVPECPDDQKRIAAILDKADAIRRKRQQALRLTDDFLRSVFLNMFGDPVTNPNEWPTKQLLELGRVSTGSTPPSSSVGMFGGAIPFITPGDLKETWTDSARTVTEAGARSARTIRAGAALVCCIGATIGKMGKAKILSAFNQQINAVEWNGSVVDDYGLDTLKFYKQIIASRGSSTTLPILNKSAFQSLEIPVAPIEMQQAYAKIVRQCEATKNQAVQAQSETEDLFASLQQRAFSGLL